MLPRYRERRFTPLDAILLIGMAALVALVVHRIRGSLDYTWRWAVIPQFLFRRDAETGRVVPNVLIQGLVTTIRLSIWAAGGALVIGTVFGVLGIQRNRAFRWITRVYVATVRNTPPLVLVFIFYFFIGNQVTTALGVDRWIAEADDTTRSVVAAMVSEPARLSEFLSAVMTLAVYEGAYITEIIRAGVQSVDKGQWEAAHALGLSQFDTYRFVILPQALRTISPALAGQFISTIKDSAIVAVISVQELTFRGLELMSATYRTFEIWITVTVLYFVLTATCSFMARLLERALRT
jgi:polar amino acid transport system permease protein